MKYYNNDMEEEDFFSRVSYLKYEDVISLQKTQKSIELNNVLDGFESEFYTILAHEEGKLDKYDLIYIANHDGIKGFALKSGRKTENRDINTLRFAKIIEEEFPNKNSLFVFNTFQSQLEKVYECYGILCIPENIASKGNLSILFSSNYKNDADYILKVNILEIYKSFFERTLNEKKIEDEDNISKVYLMYDQRNGCVKIGETKNKLNVRRKGVSEPTLRAEDPMIEVIVAWEALKDLEKKLHSKYETKRKRGEWFELTAVDLESINVLTTDYKLIEL